MKFFVQGCPGTAEFAPQKTAIVDTDVADLLVVFNGLPIMLDLVGGTGASPQSCASFSNPSSESNVTTTTSPRRLVRSRRAAPDRARRAVERFDRVRKWESDAPRAVSTGSTADWMRSLPAETRAALGRLHKLDPKRNFVIVAYPALWIACAAVVTLFPNPAVRLGGYIVMGTAIHAMAVLTHEAAHYSMFRNKTLDRWVGFFMGVPVFVSASAYRVLHAYHHKYTRDTGDPDEFNNATKNRFLLSALFYSWLVIGTPIYLIHVFLTSMIRGTWRDRRDVLVEYTLLVVIFSGAYATARHFGRTDVLLHCWAFPMIIAMIFANVRSWAEHTQTIPGDPLTQTRTVVSNRLVSFLMCNLNYHLEHHLCPSIPWYNLPAMHELMKDEYHRRNSFVYTSYLRFLFDAFRHGVHGISAMKMPSM